MSQFKVRHLILIALATVSLAFSDARAQGSESSNPSLETPPCPENPVGVAMPHTDFSRGVAGTLVCNTVHSKAQCGCKKCEFFEVPYRNGILDNVYRWGRLRRASERRRADNPVEGWLRNNLCNNSSQTHGQPPRPTTGTTTPGPAARTEFLRTKLTGGDRADCDLISPNSNSPETRARCEGELARLSDSAGDCTSYFRQRLRQGGHGYGAEQNGPRICEILVSSDALSPDEVRSRVGGGAMDRVRPTSADREDCRRIVEADSRTRRRCYRKVEDTIRAGASCQYYFAARFRQGDTCPTGEWSNSSRRNTPPTRTGNGPRVQ